MGSGYADFPVSRVEEISLEMMRLAGLPFSDRQVILASMPISIAIDNK